MIKEEEKASVEKFRQDEIHAKRNMAEEPDTTPKDAVQTQGDDAAEDVGMPTSGHKYWQDCGANVTPTPELHKGLDNNMMGSILPSHQHVQTKSWGWVCHVSRLIVCQTSIDHLHMCLCCRMLSRSES